MHPNKNKRKSNSFDQGFFKKMGGGLTSVVQIILTKGCRLVFMSSPNADMIEVNLACPKDQKGPYNIGLSS